MTVAQHVSLPLVREESCDVLVIGAGPAGFSAAISAARRGCKTMLIERQASAGGAMVLGMNLTPVGYEPFKYWSKNTDPASFAVQGIARELYDAMVAERAVIKPVWDGETAKWLIDKLLQQAGVTTLFHTNLVDAWLENDAVVGAIVLARDGLWRIRAGVSVDCSGDGDLFAKAGADFHIGRESDGRTQPMALVAMLGGLQLNLPDDVDFAGWMQLTKQQVGPQLDAAWQSGLIPPTFAGILFPRVVRGGVLKDQAWARLVPQWIDPLDPRALAMAEMTARDNLQRIVDFLRKEVAGCENAVVLHTSSSLWARSSRRLVGLVEMHEDDISTNRKRDDAIARGTGFLEVHSATPGNPRPEAGYEWARKASLIDADVDYDIAYGCLIPQKIDGLLVAGRCVSATHLAQSSLRMQITCMAMGQAAGIAAALSILMDISPRELPIGALQAALP